MNVTDAIKAVGQTGTITTGEGLTVQVTVGNVKEVYGTLRYLVTPNAGSGEAWVNAGRVKLHEGR